MDSVKGALKKLLSAFFVRQIQSVLLLMIIYMGIIIYALYEWDIWNTAQTKNTIFWCASVGFMSLFKLESIKKDRKFFKHSVLNNLKLLAVIQLVVNVYTFPLFVETLLVPIIATIGAMAAIADTDKKYAQVKSLLEIILSAFGLSVIIYAAYMLVIDFSQIAKEKTFYDFITPPLLTLLYFPFIFFMMIYSTYQQVFIRLRYSIKSNNIRLFAILYAVFVFNVRINLLERWEKHLVMNNINSHGELINSFRHIFRLLKAEKFPMDVPFEIGWSPYAAKDFLLTEGLPTGYYSKSIDEWFASSPMLEISGGMIPNNIAYYIEGTETIAKRLKIKLNVNDSSGSDAALQKFLSASATLVKKSLKKQISTAMQDAIVNTKSYFEEHDNKKITIQKEEWSKQAFAGYDIKLIITSI